MTIEVRGIKVNYLHFGQGAETLLILQGWGTNAGLYRALAEHLGQHMQVLLPELPGFGETPEPQRAWDAGDYADFAEAFLRALGIRECHLLGHSNGGRIMLKLCSRQQEEFTYRKLVFVDSAGIVPEKTARQKLRAKCYRLGKSLLRPFPKAMEAWRRRHGSADYRNASPIMRQTLVKLVNEDLRPLMPAVKQPSLLIWGTEDKDTPLSHGKEFARLLPDAGLVEVAGAGHYSYLEQPAFVYRVLDSYFGVL